jgi:hypothetical protein
MIKFLWWPVRFADFEMQVSSLCEPKQRMNVRMHSNINLVRFAFTHGGSGAHC